MEKVRYNDTYIYIDNSPLNDNETGKLIKGDLDDAKELESFSNEDLLAKTVSNLWGNKDE